MSKLISVLCVVLIVLSGLAMTGCSAAEQTEQSADLSVISADIADGFDTRTEQDYSFYVMKAQDQYKTIIEDCVDVYNLEDHITPDMEDGQIALVVANVNIVSGGYAGFCNDIFVQSVSSFTLLDYGEVAEQVDIPVAGTEQMSYYRRFFKYEDQGDTYFVFLDRQYIDVYVNGGLYMQYEYDGLDDYFAPFFESLGK